MANLKYFIIIQSNISQYLLNFGATNFKIIVLQDTNKTIKFEYYLK